MQSSMPEIVDILWFEKKDLGGRDTQRDVRRDSQLNTQREIPQGPLRHSYHNPKATAHRLVQKGELIRLKPGIYLRADVANDVYVRGQAANRLYGPSYVSFVWALRFYGLIPEDVPNLTSATFGKGKQKRFDTAAGSFFYRDIPQEAYPLAITFTNDGAGRQFLIASPEKALCDELYLKPPVRAQKDIEPLLFEDMRIDDRDFSALDRELLISLAGAYRATTLRTFVSFLEKQHRQVQYGE